VDGIQKTPYKEWLVKAKEAGHNVIWAPLSKEARGAFNETAAVEYFNSVEGLEYGYQNVIFGWIDDVVNNMPCLPPDYESNCLEWELIEPLFALVDRMSPQASNILYNQAFNHRLGTQDLGTSDLYYESEVNQNIKSIDLPTIVEDDNWEYTTTRYGEITTDKAIICCVHVCRMWKAAGLFDEYEMNCGEFGNYGAYTQTMLADEGTVQILGNYGFSLVGVDTRDPYDHMYEKCPSHAPDFERPDDC